MSKTAESTPWHRALGSKVWYFFNSLKLTISLLITLAITSILGTVIEQDLPVEQYIANYGEKWAVAIMQLGLNDMYHSFWYTGFLAMLAANIIVCTFERFPPKWRSLKPATLNFDHRFMDGLSNHQVFTVSAGREDARKKLLDVLRRKRYKVREEEHGNAWCVYAWRGVIGRYGSDFTHVSLILILAGAIIGSIWGYKDFKVVYIGDAVGMESAGFDLRLDKFWIDYYDTGQIRQYNSVLTVVEDGKDVLTKQIWVNEPLYYKGIRFYQSSYGTGWNRVADAQVALKRKARDDFDPPVRIPWGETRDIPDSPYSVKVVGYVADFAFDDVAKTVYSKSIEPNNPALRLEVYSKGKLAATPWLFLNYPGLLSTIPGTEDDLVFLGYKGMFWSGISVNKDPGTNVVWLGTAVMGVGFILAFFVFHRRLWVALTPVEGSTEIRLGGLINKNKLVFDKECREIADALKKADSGGNRQ